MRRISFIFLAALLLNVLWENAHAFLYTHYQGGDISEYILLRAAVVDAIIICMMCIPFFLNRFFEQCAWLLVVIGVLVSIGIEWYALGTGRWAYTTAMPVIPWLRTGLTPTLQLGILGYGAYKIESFIWQ